jgi:hypothetical protein
VRVLDDQHHRRLPGQVIERAEHVLEQPGPGLTGVCADIRAGVGLAELGQQPGQPPRGPAGQHRGHRVRTELVYEAAEHGGERGERQPVGAQLQAAAGQHAGPGRLRGLPELADQPGLADAGLTAQQHSRRAALAHAGERAFQGGHLLVPPDQDGTGGSPAHLCCQHAMRL